MGKALIWCFVHMITPRGMPAVLVYLRTGLVIGSLGYALYGAASGATTMLRIQDSCCSPVRLVD